MHNTKALAAGITTFVVGLALAYAMGTSPTSGTVTEPVPMPIVVKEAPFVGPRDKEKARTDLAALPELRAWFEHLEKSSGGSIRGALIEYGPTPKEIGGKHYWQFSFVENTPDAAHRWESFLVGQDTGEILVEDLESGDNLTLDQWRATKNPIARTSAN
ncbi:hypothetical protein [Massilia sp. PAMC28688]|uniref:hypothetical protein n=1 Tax=Massilia sp. PAMC28688 TaxID=2861283 RepID=UPI001E5DDE54|nr:hypothetical protein [Massilia sp. PAMC28688]